MTLSCASLLVAGVVYGATMSGNQLVSYGAWSTSWGGLSIDFLVDRFSLGFAALTAAIAGVVSAFSNRYLHREPGYNRYFVLLAMFVTGMMLVARLQIGHPAIGEDWLISSFAAPVIGGAILSGGHVSVVGTFFGVVIIAIITQALVLFAIDPFVVQIVLGALILWAVGINRLREMRVARAKA